MHRTVRKIPEFPVAQKILVAVLAALTAFFAVGYSSAHDLRTAGKPGSDQKHFASPDQAARDLLQALKNNDDAAMIALFGSEFKILMDSHDSEWKSANRGRVYKAAEEMWVWQEDGENKKIMIIGNEAWPMPFPLIKTEDRWRFDAAEGINEIMNRRIGRNELSAIEVMRAFVTSQKQFASRDRDGDGVLEYARRIKSSEGERDGLYWESADGEPSDGESADEEISPFGPMIAEVNSGAEDGSPGDPYRGYFFKILASQGSDAPGGQYSYIINGNMIAGFAMVAFPAAPGKLGIMTFLVNHNGAVYQKDLGPETSPIAKAMSEFNPDETWTKLSD